MTVLMTPDMANLPAMYGGTILKLLDGGLRLCQRRALLRHAVGRSGDIPATDPRRRAGDVSGGGQLHRHHVDGNRRQVITEDIQQQVLRHTSSCYFTMVAMGDDGKPAQVPPLQPVSDAEQHRFAAALIRKQLRQESNSATGNQTRCSKPPRPCRLAHTTIISYIRHNTTLQSPPSASRHLVTAG